MSLAIGVCRNPDFQIFLYELIIEYVENLGNSIIIIDFNHIFNENKLFSISRTKNYDYQYIRSKVEIFSPKSFEHLEQIFLLINNKLQKDEHVSLFILMPSTFFKKQHFGAKSYKRNIYDFYLTLPSLSDHERNIYVIMFDYIIEGLHKDVCFTPEEFHKSFACLIEFFPGSKIRINKNDKQVIYY